MGFRVTKTLAYNKEFQRRLVAFLLDPDGETNPLDDLRLKFYVSDTTPTGKKLMGDYSPANISSTDGIELTAWDGPIQLANGALAMHVEKTVIAGAEPTSETLVGAVVYWPAVGSAAQDELAAAVRFTDDTGADAPVTIQSEDDFISFDLVFPFTLLQDAA